MHVRYLWAVLVCRIVYYIIDYHTVCMIATDYILIMLCVAGIYGEAYHMDYSVAKSGLHGLILSLKNEIVNIIPYARCNTVAPGWVLIVI